MVAGIYGIFDQITNECLYIGQSKNVEVRWQGHIKSLKSRTHKRKEFIEWFINHDEDLQFLRFELLEICENDDEIKNKLEIKYFNKYSPIFFGKKPSVKEKWEHSDETKRKISKSMKSFNSNPYNQELKKIGVRIKKKCLGCDNIMELTPSAAKRRNCCSKKCQAKFNTINLDNDKIADLYKQGYSLHEISKKFDVSYLTIYKRLKSMNVEMRNQGGVYKN